MKVSTKSWHYRLLDKLDMYHHDKCYSLCVYFWKVVWVVALIDRYKSCKCNVCKCVFTTADQYEANWRQARKEAA